MKYIERVERKEAIEKAIRFITLFTVLLRFKNKENAFLEASKDFFPEYHERIKRLGLTVEDALEELSKKYSKISEAISISFKLYKAEFKNPKQDFDRVFKESMDLIRRERMRELDSFERKFGFYFSMLIFSPIIFLMLAPAILSIIGLNLNIVMIILSIVMAISMLFILLLITEERIEEIKDYIVLAILSMPFLTLPLVSYLYFKIFLKNKYLKEEYEKARYEEYELISYLQDAYIKISQGYPITFKEFSSKEFLLEVVNKVLKEIQLYGKSGLPILKSLRDYIVEFVDFKRNIESRLMDYKRNLKVLMFIIPVILFVSLKVFDMIAKHVQTIEAFILKIKEVNFMIIFPFINLGIAIVFTILAMISSEEIGIYKSNLHLVSFALLELFLFELLLLI